MSFELSSHIDSDKVPGAVLLVGDREKVFYHQALGVADVETGRALQPDALFSIMSMTKPVTSVAIMMLVEEGKLTLDQDASEVLPWLKEVKLIPESKVQASNTLLPVSGSITIRHLLNHTAGFGYAFSSEAIRAFEAREENESQRAPLLHEPGARWTYSIATGVLGEIIEATASQSLDMFFEERIFEPLAMTETGYYPDFELQVRQAAIHQRLADEVISFDAQPVERCEGDYGLKSTATDYFKFLQMLLNQGSGNGCQLLTAESVSAMTSNQIGPLLVELQEEVDPGISYPFPLGAGTDKFGLGFQVHADGADQRRGAGSYSWSGLYNTHFWVDPAAGIAAVALMQLLPFYDPHCMQLMDAFEHLVYTELLMKAEPPPLPGR